MVNFTFLSVQRKCLSGTKGLSVVNYVSWVSCLDFHRLCLLFQNHAAIKETAFSLYQASKILTLTTQAFVVNIDCNAREIFSTFCRSSDRIWFDINQEVYQPALLIYAGFVLSVWEVNRGKLAHNVIGIRKLFLYVNLWKFTQC